MNDLKAPEVAIPTSQESAKPGRRDVLKALNHATKEMAKDAKPLQRKFNEEGGDALNQKEKNLLADYNILAEGKKNRKHGSDDIEVQWKDYEIDAEYKGMEGIPVEGLLEFLKYKITDLESNKQESKPDVRLQEQIDRLKKDQKILKDSSLSYEEARKVKPIKVEAGGDDAEAGLEEARQRLEAFITHDDKLRRSTKQNEPEYTDENWFKAREALAQRRELIVPAQEKKPQGLPPVPAKNEKDIITPPSTPDTKRAPADQEVAERKDLPPAPIGDGKEGKPPKKPKPAPNGIPGAVSELESTLNVGIATDESRIEQEIGGLMQHDRASDKPASGFWKNMLKPITNPKEFFRNFWQNTLFKKTFDTRSLSFSRSMMEIARSKHAGLDSSIPFEMPQEILDAAKEEGKKLIKQSGIFRRIGWKMADVWSGITGTTQNSEMVFARRWFEANGKDLVEQAKVVSLAEQTRLGERFALNGRNEDIISKEIGEVRYLLDELINDKEATKQYQLKFRGFISQYTSGNLNDDELLKQFNEYYHKEIVPKIPKDKQKELKGIEVSSNFLRLAKEMATEEATASGEQKTRYQRYQEELTADGKKKWDELQFKIYIGRAKYETARGEVGLSKLEKKLIHRMVEKDYKMSKGLVLNSAVETIKDLGIYGAAYLAGGTTAAVMFGRSTFHIGGLIATPVIAGLREGFLISSKGRLVGIRGKSVADFEQVSRELASGRKSMDKAKLRPIFEQAMVDQRHANDLISPIENFLGKESLTPEEQKELMKSIAHAKARMKLADLSGKRNKELLGIGKIAVAQNFIGYSAGNQNEEMTRLRAVIVQGVAKLSGDNPQLFGRLHEAQAVYESQLRFGSRQNKLAGAVAKDLGISQADAQTAVADFYQDLGIDTSAGKSLEKAAFTLAKTVDKKAAKTAAMAFVVSPIIGAELKLAQGVIGEIGEIRSETFTEWWHEWGDVIKRDNVPLELDPSGQLVADLSPAQQAALWVRNLVEPPITSPAHNEVIDGVNVELPGNLNLAEKVIGGRHFDALVERQTGQVFDMTQYKFAMRDFDRDGDMDLVILDRNGNLAGEASTVLGNLGMKGVKVADGPEIEGASQEIDFLKTTGSKEVVIPGGGGQTIKVPEGEVSMPDGSTASWHAEWRPDAADPDKFDLVPVDSAGQVVKQDGQNIILINDAHFGANGEVKVDNPATDIHPNIQINEIKAGVGSVAKMGGPVTTGKDIWDTAVDYRVVHAGAETPSAMTDYTFSTNDADHPFGVQFRWDESAVHNPNTGATEHMSDAAADGRLGLLLQIPAFKNGEDVSIFVPAHFDAKLNQYVVDFDPTDTATQIELPNGDDVSMAELARVFLNEEKLAEHGATGDLGSELTAEGREFFDLANPDGDSMHQGRILAGYFDENSKAAEYGFTPAPGQENGAFIISHAVHGSNPVELEGEMLPPESPELGGYEITMDTITDEVKEKIPTFKISYVSPDAGIRIPFVPIPMRENIERSVKGEPAQAQAVVTTSTVTSTQAPPQAEPSEAIAPAETEEQKKEREEATELLEQKKSELEEIRKAIEVAKAAGEVKTEDYEAAQKLEEEIAKLEASLAIQATSERSEEHETGNRPELYLDQKTLDSLVKLDAKNLLNQKLDGTVGGEICRLGEGQIPYEVYQDERSRYRIRKLYNEASPIQFISENGRRFFLSTGQGMTITSGDPLLLEGKFYRLEMKDNIWQLVSMTESEKEEIEERMKNAPK